MQFDKLGPYRLGKKLGQGGMGSVYEGVDEATGQRAAIKVLSPHLAGEEGFRVRFEAEIESLKKLRHPNIVRLYGYGEEDEYLFYAMELVEGTSLEEELRAGRRFHWREVTQLAIKLCKALKHAHDHGIIHRDIKPANLLLSTSGEIRLSDFGIARLFGNTRMTNDGGVLGTAEYMAPEQADGRPVTDRCDQYSLGGVMYALLAGRPPFRASTLVEMLQLQRFAEPQTVRRWAPDTPAELDRIVRQLLEKEPQKRFVNALILARALEAMERGLSLSSQRLDFALPSDEQSGEHQPPIDALGPTLVPEAPVAARRTNRRRRGAIRGAPFRPGREPAWWHVPPQALPAVDSPRSKTRPPTVPRGARNFITGWPTGKRSPPSRDSWPWAGWLGTRSTARRRTSCLLKSKKPPTVATRPACATCAPQCGIFSTAFRTIGDTSKSNAGTTNCNSRVCAARSKRAAAR